MADSWVEKPYLSINAVDYSSKVRSVKLTFGREPIEKTAGGDGTRINMSGMKNWQIDVTLKDDYAASAMDSALFTLADAGTAFNIEVRPSTDAVSTSNPKYTGSALFSGPYDLVSGSVGALAEKTISFVPAGALSRATA